MSATSSFQQPTTAARCITIVVVLFLAVPLASAQSIPWETRDQGWSPKGSGVPDLWVPHVVVQRETAELSVIEFQAPDATIEVFSPAGASLYRHELHMQSYGTGYYGNVSWRVPADAAPGMYTVNATSSQGGVSTTMQVLEGPHLFAACDACEHTPSTVSLEAVGFDAAPVTADFLQGTLRWSAKWQDGRGMSRAVGDPVVATVPGAANPQQVLGASDGSESVSIRPQLVTETGAPLHAWFNGTVDGVPSSLTWNWTMPPRDPGVLVRISDQAYVNDTLSVIVYGLREGNVSLAWNGRGPGINASDGFFQGVLDLDREGNTTIHVKGLTMTGEPFQTDLPLHVNPRPIAMPEEGGSGMHAVVPTLGIAPIAMTLALITLILRRTAR